MKRIFLTLAAVGMALLGASFVFGLRIEDPRDVAEAALAARRLHLLTALAGLLFVALVHAVVLTYFMGTGRWIEETSRAYQLGEQWLAESRVLKHRTVPPMVLCLVLLILTAAFGAGADPASAVRFGDWLGLGPGTIHFLLAATTVGVNLVVNLLEYAALDRNGQLVDEVVARVLHIRRERGLPG
ncbi:MAG: hypothetical protein WD069_16345 [Planctomycetales bacterium]